MNGVSEAGPAFEGRGVRLNDLRVEDRDDVAQDFLCGDVANRFPELESGLGAQQASGADFEPLDLRRRDRLGRQEQASQRSGL